MKILSIETSCDETAISLLEMQQQDNNTHVNITANELTSQADEHEGYGGVFPTLAKRLHGQNFAPLFSRLCNQVDTSPYAVNPKEMEQIEYWLKRHDGLPKKLKEQAESDLPDTDYIAVTIGPGLLPALWVGVNIARSLALITDTPLLPVNHMSGHIISTLVPNNYQTNFTLKKPKTPSIALLASGGHTELITRSADGSKKKIGQTKDDAAGEAFDKVGRLLGLSYPAGPEVSALADTVRNSQSASQDAISLPRPMLKSQNLNMSFAGLKSAAARLIEKYEPLDDTTRAEIAYELESAIVEVLVQKTKRAIKTHKAKSILAGGGVLANPHLRDQLKELRQKETLELHLAPRELTTDNAIMIGLSAGARLLTHTPQTYRGDKLQNLSADSRLSL